MCAYGTDSVVIMQEILDWMSNSKVLIGCAILLTNVGGRFIPLDLSKREEKLLKSPFARRLIIFLTVLVTTRDILISLIVLLLFLLFTKRGKIFEAKRDLADD